MAQVTSYSDDKWALSDEVTSSDDQKGILDIPTHGEVTDVEDSIDSATGRVQGWWVEETGQDYPEDLPEPSSLQDENELLADATAYMAASLEHEKHDYNVGQAQDEGPGRKFRRLEKTAREQFEAWIVIHGFDQPIKDGDDPDSRVDYSGQGVGQIDSLVDIE